jgi:hypothetical protein
MAMAVATASKKVVKAVATKEAVIVATTIPTVEVKADEEATAAN